MAMFREVAKELLDFINKSYSSFHLIYNMKEELKKNGFSELYEGEKWKESGKINLSPV